MAKATKRQMIEREEDIRAALAKGERTNQFAPQLAKKHRCSEGSIIHQYRVLMKELAEINKESREEFRAEMKMRAQHVFAQALKEKMYKTALDAINVESKISGLYQPEKPQEKEKEAPPSFQFKERGEAIPLAVVPEDDDDKDAGNS